MKNLLVVLLFVMVVGVVCGQEKLEFDSSAVKTPEAATTKLLELLSREENAKPNLNAIRSLFMPDATFRVLHNDASGTHDYISWTMEEFINLIKNNYHKPFLEKPLKSTIDEYNGIAHVFQGYYADAGNTTEKGINSYQLVYWKNRWWITAILWTNDKNGIKIPKECDE